MQYYIKETVFDEIRQKTAASKAREDMNEIMEDMGFRPVEVEYDYSLRKEKGMLKALKKLTGDWKNALKTIGNGDVVFIQFPLNHHPMGVAGELKRLKKRGGKVIILIHDIDSLRNSRNTPVKLAKYCKIRYEDLSILGAGDVVIAHNAKMAVKLEEMGISKEKLVTLELFDYLVHDEKETDKDAFNVSAPVVIAGTLRRGKAGYVYSLPDTIRFNLYGVGYEGEDNERIAYKGSFSADAIVSAMEGSFGLVWDGQTSETCEGMSGQYLMVNNPHKTSLYLTSGLPVIIWEKAAMADLVLKEGCGITVGSLKELPERIGAVSDDEYTVFKTNAARIARKLRSGYYARTAVSKALQLLETTF